MPSRSQLTFRTPLDLKVIGLTAWATLVAVQSLWWQEQGIVPLMLVIPGGAIGLLVCLRRSLFLRYPISALITLGFPTYYFLLPPIATLLEGKPLTNNLLNPVLVFLHAFVCLLLLLAAHFVYRKWAVLQNLRWLVADRVYRPLGFFRAPSNLQLLAMGCIGLLATYLQVVVGGGVQQELRGVGSKLLQALFQLAYLPLAILVREAMGKKTRLSRGWLVTMVVYTVVLLVLSVARNSRTVLLQGLASVAMVYVFSLSTGLLRTRRISLKHLALILVGVVMLLGPVADLATSIVIVRSERRRLSAGQLIQRTVEAFGDKEAIKARRLAALDPNAVWDERYVDNEFMARLANLKFADNSIDLALMMDDGRKSYFRRLEFERALSALPRPLLRSLGLAVDKDFVGGSSGGDLLLYAATGNSYVLGGFRAGSIFGSGYALFGWIYPFILALSAPLLFALADALTSRMRTGPGQGSGEWLPVLSPMAVIGFFGWFSYFTSAARGMESFSSVSYYLLRGWLEVLVIYALAYWVSYYAVKPFTRVRSR